ncbi:hypothetical protein MtrunA17_Chr8g0350341 [Medicago truncatula]|uniref:Transmembrane protein n=1 Tax=Medicago truncatula TaxID=3880 RepID=A0A396GHG5_MEDTR|nr:hypothetical protein MtrunA17_Chr8g0350341 [Medicago truncatula]
MGFVIQNHHEGPINENEGGPHPKKAVVLPSARSYGTRKPNISSPLPLPMSPSRFITLFFLLLLSRFSVITVTVLLLWLLALIPLVLLLDLSITPLNSTSFQVSSMKFSNCMVCIFDALMMVRERWKKEKNKGQLVCMDLLFGGPNVVVLEIERKKK